MPNSYFHSEDEMENTPMNRYVNPIPAPCHPSPGCCKIQQEGIDHILTALSCQNQILIDLLGAVNNLTAVLLCKQK